MHEYNFFLHDLLLHKKYCIKLLRNYNLNMKIMLFKYYIKRIN